MDVFAEWTFEGAFEHSREHREPNPLSSRRVCWYMKRVGVFVNLSGTAVRRIFTVSNLEYSRSEAAFFISGR